MKAELIPLEGGQPIPITKDVTVVGRREFCDIQIDHPSLSKRHCVLVKTEGLLVIRDLATTNGTKVKGQKIRWAALLPEDRISLGSVKFKVYLGPDNVLAPSEAPPKPAKAALPSTSASPSTSFPTTRGYIPASESRGRPSPTIFLPTRTCRLSSTTRRLSTSIEDQRTVRAQGRLLRITMATWQKVRHKASRSIHPSRPFGLEG